MITRELLLDWGAVSCQLADQIATTFRGRPGLTPREVAADESLDLDHRLRIVCGALEYRNEAAARAFAINCAVRVSHLTGNPTDQAEYRRLVADLERLYTLPSGDRKRDLLHWQAALHAGHAKAVCKSSAWGPITAAATVRADIIRAFTWAAASTAADVLASARVNALSEFGAWDSAYDTGANTISKSDAWDVSYDAEIKVFLGRALTALGSDADGWPPLDNEKGSSPVSLTSNAESEHTIELEDRLAACRETITKLATVLCPGSLAHEPIIRAAEELTARLERVVKQHGELVEAYAKLLVERDALRSAKARGED